MDMTKEQMAQQIADEVAGKGLFLGMSASQVTAILLCGGRKDELETMLVNARQTGENR